MSRPKGFKHPEATIEKMKHYCYAGHNKASCACYICRAARGEYRGNGNPSYGKPKSPASLKKQSASMSIAMLGNKNGSFRTKENQLKTIRLMLAKVCARPNNFEKFCGEYLGRLFPNKFRYTGDGSLMINRRSPDYFSEELKVVVLCNGLYWHLFRFGLTDTPENRQQIELKESIPFRDAGYEVWFIWEDQRDHL